MTRDDLNKYPVIIAEEECPDHVSVGRKTVYGIGGLAENIMYNAVNNMANPVFNVGLGVSPVLLGTASFIFRMWDAITDPLMGIFSDRAGTRFGRRRPFIVVGALFSGLFFSLIWWTPQGMGQLFYFWWFVLAGLAFYTAFTVFGVPYQALGYEISSDYHERTGVMAFRTWFASVGGFAIQWLFWLTQRECFSNTVEGMRYIGMVVGVFLMIAGAAPGVFLKERQPDNLRTGERKQLIPFSSMVTVFSVKPFLWILATLAATIMGMFMVSILGWYVNVYYVFGGNQKEASTVIGVAGSFYHATCMFAVPVIARISRKIGKRRTLMLFLSVAAIGAGLKWICFTPKAPYLQLIAPFLMAPGLASMWTLLPSMVADVTDYDELKNGSRREGSFGAAYSWTMKLGFAFCFFLAGVILKASGFDSSLGSSQTIHTLTIMRALFSSVPCAGFILSMLLIRHFPITEKRAGEIRSLLNSKCSEQ